VKTRIPKPSTASAIRSSSSRSTKVRQPRVSKLSASNDDSPLVDLVLPKKEEPEIVDPVIDDRKILEEITESNVEPIDKTVPVTIVKEVEESKPIVYPEQAVISKARIVVKCSTYVCRGRRYKLGDTFVVEGRLNILEFSCPDLFDVFYI
jgi:hypothetical protein